MLTYLDVVCPHLSPALLSSERLAWLRTTVGVLPRCEMAGFEVRLAADAPDVDFLVCLPRAAKVFSAATLAHPAWQVVQRARQLVSEPGAGLVGDVLLEFDLDAPPAPVPIPGVFLDIHHDLELSPEAVHGLVSAMGNGLTDVPASHDVLERCVTALPAGATVSHLGAMLSRPGHGLRVSAQGLHPSAVPGYLHDIGWRDQADALPALIGQVAALADPWMMVGFDVTDRVSDRVGVEFYLRRGNDGRERWAALLDHLVRLGMACDAKVQGVLAWPGVTLANEATESWPGDLVHVDRLLRGVASSVIWRRTNHVKLVYQPGVPTSAKVYLGFGHSWRPVGTAPGA